MKIYVAGPYSAPSEDERLRNVRRAIAIAMNLRIRGHEPFIPHLTHYVDLHARAVGIEFDYESYMAWDRAFQGVCEGFYYMGPSPGADRELARAKELGQRIFMTMDEVPLAHQVVVHEV
jgi:hypothetical protein